MSQRDRFKVAVLALCADQGMSLGETLTLVKHASEKQAVPVLSEAYGLAKGVGKSMGKYTALGLLAGPAALGALGGYGAAKLTTGMNDRTTKEVKRREIIDELRQQTRRAKLQTFLSSQRKATESTRGRGLL